MTGQLQQIFNLIVGAVIGIIAAGGLIFGGYKLWDGFTGDRPENQKSGGMVLIITVIAVVVLLAAKSIVWNMISSNLSTGSAGMVMPFFF